MAGQDSARKALLDLGTGYWKSQAVYVAAKLGIADLVQDGPKTSDELATATGTHAPSLYRLLRALASVGVFTDLAGPAPPGLKFSATIDSRYSSSPTLLMKGWRSSIVSVDMTRTAAPTRCQNVGPLEPWLIAVDRQRRP